MAVGYKLVRETFTSKVTLDRPALEIRADYLDGPFRAHGEQLDASAASRGRLARSASASPTSSAAARWRC